MMVDFPCRVFLNKSTVFYEGIKPLIFSCLVLLTFLAVTWSLWYIHTQKSLFQDSRLLEGRSRFSISGDDRRETRAWDIYRAAKRRVKCAPLLLTLRWIIVLVYTKQAEYQPIQSLLYTATNTHNKRWDLATRCSFARIKSHDFGIHFEFGKVKQLTIEHKWIKGESF